MGETWTVGRLIKWAAGYLREHGAASPRLSGELLLAKALDCRRVDLYLRHDQPLAAGELAEFKKLILRRKEHEPVAYILGRREFYGHEFKVGPGVLVPRPETEHLVEEAALRAGNFESPRILDLCTGSGAVALALLKELETATAVGVDISGEALAYARANADALGLSHRAQWLQGSLYDPVAAGGGFFELITANPPYVRDDEWEGLEPEVRCHEPRRALVGGGDGLGFIRQIIAGSGAFLRAGGWLLMEMGQGQDQAALGLSQAAGIFVNMEIIKDLAGIGRVLTCQRGDYG